MINRNKINRWDWIGAILACMVSLVTLFCVYSLGTKNWSVPIIFSNDGTGGIFAIKNICDGDGFFHFASLSAPFGEYNYTEDFIFPLLVVYVISIFTKDVGLISNLFWIATYVITAITAYFFIRKLRLSSYTAIMGAVIYNFLPYHYFRLEHFWLFGCYAIPLAGWVIVDMWQLGQRNDFEDWQLNKWKHLLIDFAFCLIIGLNGMYYSVFSIFLLAFSMIVAKFYEKNWKLMLALIAEIIIIFVPAAIFTIGLDKWLGINQSGFTASVRPISELELYGLRLFIMFLPIPGHRIERFSTFTEQCYKLLNVYTENYTEHLGLLMSIGCVISLIAVFADSNNNFLKKLGLMNVFIMLFATIGGFDLFIGFFVSSAIRCYNRMSIFIALFSIGAFCITLEYLFEKIRIISKNLEILICIGFCLLGVWDQTSPMFAEYSTYDLSEGYQYSYTEIGEQYFSYEEYFNKIESQISANSNVYIMPNEIVDDSTRAFRMKLYVTAETLNWSYSTLRSQYSRWMTEAENQEQSVFLETLAIMNFNGILIDKNAYASDETFKKTLKYIQEETSAKPIISDDNLLFFFDLEDYFGKIRDAYGEELPKAQDAIQDMINGSYQYYSIDNFYTSNGGKILSEKAEVGAGDIFFGPYTSLKKGYYKIRVCGENLEKIEVGVTTDGGNNNVEINNVVNTGNCVEYTFELKENAENVEFLAKSEENFEIQKVISYGMNNRSKDIQSVNIENLEWLIKRLGWGSTLQRLELNEFLVDGKQIKKGKEDYLLRQGELMYGPYCSLGKGIYRVTIIGNNLEGGIIKAGAFLDSNVFEVTILQQDSDYISYEFQLKDDASNVEFYLQNDKEDSIIKDIYLEYSSQGKIETERIDKIVSESKKQR